MSIEVKVPTCPHIHSYPQGVVHNGCSQVVTASFRDQSAATSDGAQAAPWGSCLLLCSRLEFGFAELLPGGDVGGGWYLDSRDAGVELEETRHGGFPREAFGVLDCACSESGRQGKITEDPVEGSCVVGGIVARDE